MKILYSYIVPILMLLSVSLTAQEFNQQPVDFNSGFGPFDLQLGLDSEGFDLGLAQTTKAGGSGSEFGGLFARTNTMYGHFIADTTIGEISRLDRLEMTGKFTIEENLNADGSFFIGWANLEIAETFPIAEAQNLLGISINEPSGEDGFRVFSVSNTSQAERVRGTVTRVLVGEQVTFSFVWVPSFAEDGTGQATLTLTTPRGELESFVEEVRFIDAVDLPFDSFIIGGVPASSPSPNQAARAWWDDLSYTVKREIVDPSDWAGFSVDQNGWADTDNFFGWLNVTEDPWIFSLSLNKWIFLPEANVGDSGGWTYVTRP